MTAYEHARSLVASAQIAWVTTYDGCAGRPVPLALGSPVDVVEDPAGRLVVALRRDDGVGHLDRLARVPAATLLVCEPAASGSLADDAVARVVIHGRARLLEPAVAARAAVMALAQAHEHLEPDEVVPVVIEATGIRYRPRDGEEALLDPAYFSMVPPGKIASS